MQVKHHPTHEAEQAARVSPATVGLPFPRAVLLPALTIHQHRPTRQAAGDRELPARASPVKPHRVMFLIVQDQARMSRRVTANHRRRRDQEAPAIRPVRHHHQPHQTFKVAMASLVVRKRPVALRRVWPTNRVNPKIHLRHRRHRAARRHRCLATRRPAGRLLAQLGRVLIPRVPRATHHNRVTARHPAHQP